MIRIAHEISERNDRLDNVVLVGIKTRGVPFANRLAECIYTRIDNSVKIPVGTLDISAFRDDVDKNVRDRSDAGEMPCDINGKTVILTDDVMCTGRTVRAALDALIREHQPAVFFSKDLFARYFTYTKNSESHFILFDDADTLRQKLRLGRQLGVAAAFFQWPEVCDIADSLFRRK